MDDGIKSKKGNLFNKTENVQGNFHYHRNELYKKNKERSRKNNRIRIHIRTSS